MFKALYLPHGRAAAEDGGTAVPQEFTLTARSHSLTADITLDVSHGLRAQEGLPCLHPLPHTLTPAQAALPIPQTPSEPSPGSHPPRDRGGGLTGTRGDATAPALATSAASLDRCHLSWVSFAAQSHLSHIMGKLMPVLAEAGSAHRRRGLHTCM